MSSTSADRRKRKLTIPNALVLLFIFIVAAMILTWVIPAGQYDRVFDEASGYEIVDPTSFRYIERTPVDPLQMLSLIGVGFGGQAQIIFSIIFACIFIGMLKQSGTIDALFGAATRKLKSNVKFLLPVIMVMLSLMGSVAGIAEESYGLYPVCITLAVALGYDEIVGIAISYLAVFTGFASATMNPFTIGVAQSIAQVPLFSGIWLRIICYVVYMAVLIAYTMRYAARIKADPTKSLMYGVKSAYRDGSQTAPTEHTGMTVSQKLCAVVFLLTMVMMAVGTLVWGWYLNEIIALFCGASLLIGIINRMGPNEIAGSFIKMTADTAFPILAIGLANVICAVMDAGHITDTVLHAFATLLQTTSGYFSAVLMMVLQTLLNFFIPSGPGQAAVSMPIMAPLADLCGLSRQTAVLAFQFGDGYSNIFWPTMVVSVLGMVKLPTDKFYKFMGPLFAIMFGLQIVFMCIAVAVGY